MPRLTFYILTLMTLSQSIAVCQELKQIALDNAVEIALPPNFKPVERSDRVELVAEDSITKIVVERMYLGQFPNDSLQVYSYSNGQIDYMLFSEPRTMVQDSYQVINEIEMRRVDVRTPDPSVFTNVYFANLGYIYVIRFYFKASEFNREYVDKVLMTVRKR